ncbi:hypothetical protein FRC01_013639 [Tulasnella sp. 417]|nr:hypothetical protein FRC01_013639 [Tulasnella sp. 417]
MNSKASTYAQNVAKHIRLSVEVPGTNPSASQVGTSIDKCDPPPSPDLVDLSDFELPTEVDLEGGAHGGSSSSVASADPRTVDLWAYNGGAPEDLWQEYEGDVKWKGEGHVYYDPASSEIPSEKKVVLKAKRRYKLCQKIMERARKADVASVSLLEDARVASTGYQGVRRDRAQPIPSTFRLVRNLERPTIFRDRHGRRAVIYMPHAASRDAHLEGLRKEINRIENAMPAAPTERGDFGTIQLQLHRDVGAKEPVYSRTYKNHKKSADEFLNSGPAQFYARYISGAIVSSLDWLVARLLTHAQKK